MKLPRTNIGHPGSPPSKGGISGAGGYIMPKRPSFKEYYATKKRPLKEDEEEEKGGVADAAVKVLAGIGLVGGAAMALSPDFRNWLADKVVKGIMSTDEALTAAHDRLQQQQQDAELKRPPVAPPTEPPLDLDIPPLPR